MVNTRRRRNMRRSRRRTVGGGRKENIQALIEQKRDELSALEKELMELNPVSPELEQFVKMKRMGVPEGAIRAKASLAGVNVSSLFGKSSSASAASTPASAPRPQLNLGGISGATLRKASPQEKSKFQPPSNSKASTQAQLAQQAVAQLGKLRKVSRPPNMPASISPGNPFASASVQQRNETLPAGWKEDGDGKDTWYVSPEGEALWEPLGWKQTSDSEFKWYVSPKGNPFWKIPIAGQ